MQPFLWVNGLRLSRKPGPYSENVPRGSTDRISRDSLFREGDLRGREIRAAAERAYRGGVVGPCAPLM